MEFVRRLRAARWWMRAPPRRRPRPRQGRPSRTDGPGALILTLLLGVALAGTVIVCLEMRLRPIVYTVARAQATNALTAVVDGAIASDLSARQVGYVDFVDIQRDATGSITSMSTDMAAMNLLRAEIVSDVLTALDGVDVSEIRIPLGSLLDTDLLWAKGPDLHVQSMRVGTVSAEFHSSFSEAGVNQTLHRINLEVSVPLTLILPGGKTDLTVETGLCVAETVIVGAVPETYLTINGN